MQSDSCTNNTARPGLRTLSTQHDHVSVSKPATPPPFRYCTHVTAAGRHCRMLALIDSELCAHHNRAREKRLHKQPGDKPLADLLGSVPTFDSPASVHHFIADVVKQFAQKRISRPDALAFGYFCQLLLTSFSDHRKWTTRKRT